jgi:hypothetical protein
MGGNLVWKCTLPQDLSCFNKISSKFIRQMLKALADIHVEYPVQEQIIWNNKNICIKHKHIYWVQWLKKGILYYCLANNNNYIEYSPARDLTRIATPFSEHPKNLTQKAMRGPGLIFRCEY